MKDGHHDLSEFPLEMRRLFPLDMNAEIVPNKSVLTNCLVYE